MSARKDIFLPSGYLDFERIMKFPEPFLFVVGARGVGKTYGVLKYCVEKREKFIYSRRTQKQIDLINTPEMNIFKPYNMDAGTEILPVKTGAGLYAYRESAGGKEYGVNMALSTFANFRGFSAADVSVWIYDEFIPEASERPIRNEGAAFLNAYETINRNRELNGAEPVKVVCLANSNTIDNPLFMELQIIDPVYRAQKSGAGEYVDQKRGVRVILVTASPVSEAKKDTALYRLTAGTSFAEMAVENKFSDVGLQETSSRNLSEYVLHTAIGEICIYKHKSRKEYYVTGHRSGATARDYSLSDTDLERFRRNCWPVWMAYLSYRVIFERVSFELIFCRYFGGRT